MDKYQTLHEKNNPTNNVYPNIKTQNVPDDAITTAKVADDAITTAKIADDAITGAKIADATIQTNNLDDEIITTDKLASNAVITSKIALLAVGTPQLKDDAVTLDKLSISIENWTTSTIAGLQDLYDEFRSLLSDIRVLRIFYNESSTNITDFVVKANDNQGNVKVVFGNYELNITTDQDAIDFYNNYIVPGYIKIIRLGE